ncbi:HD domain-containing protein [Candidatus Margulisiibacteriota bacterium]
MLSRVWTRIKQFYISMFSQYTKADEAFARSYLNIQEMALFNQLPGFEKRHSVTVARKMMNEVHGKQEFDERKMVRLGLLHDIGKVGERNSILTKSILVIIRFFCPWLYDKLADEGRDHPVFRRFYIHKHHGAVGAKLLERIGVSSEILSIIAKHDPRIEPFGPETPVEQEILNEADSTY